MKISQPMNVAGFYRQSDGQWQTALVLTDGVDVLETSMSTLTDAPQTQSASLAGIEAALGQTIDVAPEEIANRCACPVVSDFHSSDMEMGGQGTPLHPFYLHALSRMAHQPRPLVYLLVEDAVSLVWVDPRVNDPTNPNALVSFDTGPAFGPLKGLAQANKAGQVVDGALELFLDDPYFRRLPPKRVEPSNFGPLLELVAELSPEDARATILGMAATSVLLAQEHLPSPPAKVVVMGQGAKSALFIKLLTAALDVPIETPNTEEFDPNTINAQAIAYLAARAARGLPTTAPHTTGVAAAVGGGTITDSA